MGDMGEIYEAYIKVCMWIGIIVFVLAVVGGICVGKFLL